MSATQKHNVQVSNKISLTQSTEKKQKILFSLIRKHKELIIKQSEMNSYLLKKEEFKNAHENVKSEQLKSHYKDCLKQTEACFTEYTNFYNKMREVVKELENIEKESTKNTKEVVTKSVAEYEKAKEMYNKYKNKTDIFSSELNVSKHAATIAEASANLAILTKQQYDISQNTIAHQIELLNMLLEHTFDSLFNYLYLMNISNINKNAVKEFLSFVAGNIPVFGIFASGVIAIVNTINNKHTVINSTDETLFYLESYLEFGGVFCEITEGYVNMLSDWKTGLGE